MQQENITTNTGKYSPLKIFSYPVNPHHRESMRSCPLNTGGLPQQRSWIWLQTLEPHTSKSNLKGKIKQTKEKAKSGRVYTPRLDRPVQERKTTRCGGLIRPWDGTIWSTQRCQAKSLKESHIFPLLDCCPQSFPKWQSQKVQSTRLLHTPWHGMAAKGEQQKWLRDLKKKTGTEAVPYRFWGAR